MYLHLGQECIIRTKEILGIFDLDSSTLSKHTRDYLARAEKEGRVVNVTAELPKSFIVTTGENAKVYICLLYTSRKDALSLIYIFLS